MLVRKCPWLTASTVERATKLAEAVLGEVGLNAVQQRGCGDARKRPIFDRMNKTDGGWKVTAAAWLVSILFAGLLGATDALASRHHGRPRECALAGADEIAASDWLERVRAEAYSGM